VLLFVGTQAAAEDAIAQLIKCDTLCAQLVKCDTLAFAGIQPEDDCDAR
jgi:hypothetical protein